MPGNTAQDSSRFRRSVDPCVFFRFEPKRLQRLPAWHPERIDNAFFSFEMVVHNVPAAGEMYQFHEFISD